MAIVFLKGFSIQRDLLVMTEEWWKCVDKGCTSGGILTDLSKDLVHFA